MVDAHTMQMMVNMKDLIFLPFSSVHINSLNLGDTDLHLISCMDQMEERMRSLENQRCAWTIFYQGNPALSYGFEYKFPGNVEAWLLPGKVAIDHGTLLSRGARRLFDKIGPHLDLRRLQIVVDVEREAAVQWAEFLKFKREGVMKMYGPEGHDYYMYARTYE
jgi:hypothetical protein